MTTQTYLSSYGSAQKRRTVAELNRLQWWNRVHPEMRRRILAMCDAAAAAGLDKLGPGGGFRTSKQQDQLHESQPGLSPASGGSYHEACATPEGDYALAVDMIWDASTGPAIAWMVDNAPRFALVSFHDYKNEDHHVQPVEVSRSRSRTRTTPYKLTTAKLPTAAAGGAPSTPVENPAPPAKPATYPSALGAWGPLWAAAKPELAPVPKPKRNDATLYLQGVLGVLAVRIIGGAALNPGPADGLYGPRTAAAVRCYQATRALWRDGIVGPRTWASIDGDALDLVTPGGRV